MDQPKQSIPGQPTSEESYDALTAQCNVDMHFEPLDPSSVTNDVFPGCALTGGSVAGGRGGSAASDAGSITSASAMANQFVDKKAWSA